MSVLGLPHPKPYQSHGGNPLTFAEVIRCPDCHGGPVEGHTCLSCSRAFEEDRGTLKLFPTDIGQPFPVRYVTLEEVHAALEQALGVPDQSGAQGSVHHLDRAHIPYFESLPAGAGVLEIGCGGGQMRQWVESIGLNYLGTDISKTRVPEVLQLHGGPDFLSDAHHLPLHNESVDLVYSAAVTEHLAAPQRAVQEIWRVLRPGGVFLGNCSFMEPWHDESFYHMSPNGAAALLLQAGFQVEAVWPSHNYSGYISLMAMGNKATQALRALGWVMNTYSRSFYRMKSLIKGQADYDNRLYAKDMSITAGATDWVARKGIDGVDTPNSTAS